MNISENTLELIKKRNELNRQLETLEFLSSKLNRFTDYNINMLGSGDTNTVIFRITEAKLILNVLNALKPSRTYHEVPTSKGLHVVRSPYAVTLKHPINQPPKITISWLSGEYLFEIETSIKCLSERLNAVRRFITPNEYHYFNALSMRQLEKTETVTTQFKHGLMLTYSGNATVCKQLNEKEISIIIQKLCGL